MSDQEEGEVKLIVNKSQQNQELSPNELLKKLDVIKEIKQKTVNLQRIKLRLQQELNTVDTEVKCLESFQNELDLLFQEKYAHIEELKQIQSDINELELTIKHADEEKRRAYDSAIRLKNEYKPLNDSINLLRESIGLNKNTDEDDVINSFMQLETTSASQSPNTKHATNRKSPLTNSNKEQNQNLTSNNHNNSNNLNKTCTINETIGFNQNISATTNSQNTPTDLSVSLATAALVAAQQLNNSKLLNIPNVLTANDTRQHLTVAPQSQLQQTQSLPPQSVVPPAPPAFRQQPPPMKACLSCNQQIHRNAPICPLCKAKSRSRNPKKPKKKQNDDGK